MTIAHSPAREPQPKGRIPITRAQFLGYLNCLPLYVMIVLMVTEAALAAMTTYFMIRPDGP